MWIPFRQHILIAESPYSTLQIFAGWAHRGLAMRSGFDSGEGDWRMDITRGDAIIK